MPSLRNIEAGAGPVPLDKMLAIKEALGLTEDELARLNTLAFALRAPVDKPCGQLHPEWFEGLSPEKKAGQLLCDYRVLAYMTIKQAVQRIDGVFDQNWRKWELGKGSIPQQHYPAIQQSLGLSDPQLSELRRLMVLPRSSYVARLEESRIGLVGRGT